MTIIKSLVLLLTAYASSAGAMAPSACESILRQGDEMRADIDQVRADQKRFAKINALALPRGNGLLEAWQLGTGNPPQVVLINLTRFFGDNVIFAFSIIPFLRERFAAPFTFISPNASALRGTLSADFTSVSWPVTFAQHREPATRVAEIMRMKRMFEPFFRQHVRPGAFVVYDLTTLDKADEEMKRLYPDERLPSTEFRKALAQLKVTAIGLSMLRSERIHLGLTGVDILAPRSKLTPALAARTTNPEFERLENDVAHVGLRGRLDLGKTVYEAWLRITGLVFGNDAYLRWNSGAFVRVDVDPERVEVFKSEAGLRSGREHVILNLNTFGADKVRDLKLVYSQTLETVIDHILGRYPDLDVLIPLTENQYGPEVQAHALEFCRRHRGRVALIPRAYLDAQALMFATARWIVSYDPGPFHLAAFLPGDRVLSVGLASASSDVWRKPKQAYIKIDDPKKSASLGTRICRAIDRDLEPAARR